MKKMMAVKPSKSSKKLEDGGGDVEDALRGVPQKNKSQKRSKGEEELNKTKKKDERKHKEGERISLCGCTVKAQPTNPTGWPHGADLGIHAPRRDGLDWATRPNP